MSEKNGSECDLVRIFIHVFNEPMDDLRAVNPLQSQRLWQLNFPAPLDDERVVGRRESGLLIRIERAVKITEILLRQWLIRKFRGVARRR